MIIKLDITRQVLTEKFSIKNEMEVFFLSFLEGCELKSNKKYSDSLFYIKNDKIMFEYQFKSKYFWVRYDIIWSVFEQKYLMEYDQIQKFLKNLLEKHLKQTIRFIPCFTQNVIKFMEMELEEIKSNFIPTSLFKYSFEGCKDDLIKKNFADALFVSEE